MGTSQNMQIVDDGTPRQIEVILAHAAIARQSSLPPANTSQSMLYSSPFAQFGPSFGISCRFRHSMSNASSGWMLTLHPLGLVVHCVRKGH
jgi:hypothetical protein